MCSLVNYTKKLTNFSYIQNKFIKEFLYPGMKYSSEYFITNRFDNVIFIYLKLTPKLPRPTIYSGHHPIYRRLSKPPAFFRLSQPFTLVREKPWGTSIHE